MTRWHRWAWTAIALAVLLVLWGSLGMIYPWRIYSRFDLVQVDSVVRSGEVAHTRLSICKETEAVSTVSVSLQNHTFYPLPLTVANLPKGCHDIPWGVRADVPPGEYKIVVVSLAESNPFRREFYRAEVPLEVR